MAFMAVSGRFRISSIFYPGLALQPWAGMATRCISIVRGKLLMRGANCGRNLLKGDVAKQVHELQLWVEAFKGIRAKSLEEK
jgi:hypothetical protein